jgi:4-carboxymuconolactone decarboxylase
VATRKPRAAPERERYDLGMTTRRAVLGAAHVDRAQAHLNDFNRDFQEFITRYAWGEVWTRPGLSRHTRSLLTLTLMVALNRGAEFKMHVRAAFNNGVTRDEIKEVLLHAALYAGLPAANEAHHLAQSVFDELDAAKKPTSATPDRPRAPRTTSRPTARRR